MRRAVALTLLVLLIGCEKREIPEEEFWKGLVSLPHKENTNCFYKARIYTEALQLLGWDARMVSGYYVNGFEIPHCWVEFVDEDKNIRLVDPSGMIDTLSTKSGLLRNRYERLKEAK